MKGKENRKFFSLLSFYWVIFLDFCSKLAKTCCFVAILKLNRFKKI